MLPGCEGGRGRVSFGGGVVVGFCFGGCRGPVSFRAVKGEGGESALVVVLLSVFILGGAASGL